MATRRSSAQARSSASSSTTRATGSGRSTCGSRSHRAEARNAGRRRSPDATGPGRSDAVANVRQDLADLIAEEDERDDRHDRDQRQDEGVFRRGPDRVRRGRTSPTNSVTTPSIEAPLRPRTTDAAVPEASSQHRGPDGQVESVEVPPWRFRDSPSAIGRTAGSAGHANVIVAPPLLPVVATND